MSEHGPLEPLDAEIAAMLAREGSRLEAPSGDVEARLWGKLSGAIGGSGGDSGSSDGSDPGAGGGAGAGAGAGAAGGLLSRAAPYLATLIAGGAIGAIVHAQVQPPRVVYVDRAVASASVTTNGSPVASGAPSSSVATVSIDALPSVAAPAPKTSASAESDEAFVAERRLLDAARAALASGDAQATLARVEEHVRSYPKGRFQEEREALRVRALADAGRRDEAKSAATRFEARWPGSVLLPTVKAAVE